MIDVSEADFERLVIKGERPVLVDFWAPWCGPCNAMTPILDSLAEEFNGSVDVVKVDVDQNPAMRDRFGVRGIPALKLFKNGEVVASVVGVQTRSRLRSILAEIAAPSAEATESKPLSAFGGDALVKRACIERLNQHIDAGAIALRSPWDGEKGTAIACATHANDEEAAALLQMPFELLVAIDELSVGLGAPRDAGAFIAQWLEAITPGADLTRTPAAFAIAILEGDVVEAAVQSDRNFLELRKQCISSLRRMAEGRAVDANDQKSLRAHIEAETYNSTDSTWLARLLYGSTWVGVDIGALNEMIGATAILATKQEMDRHGYTQAEDSAVMSRMNEIHQHEFEATGLRDGLRVRELYEAENPEAFRRFSKSHEDRSAARSRLADALGSLIIEQVRSVPAGA